MEQSSAPTSKTLWCFSPPIMLFTFALEFCFAVYVLFTGKRTRSTALIIALLVCLGIFQLAEYQVCGTGRDLTWMRVGYASITLLPPLGIHLVSLVTKHRWVRNLGYVMGAVFLTYFLIDTRSVSSAVCGGNYILIHTDGILGAHLFPVYYDLALLLALVDIVYSSWLQPRKRALGVEGRSLLLWLIAAYAAFLVPTGAVYLLSSADTAGIPSIMCGFAIFLAIVLVMRVYPACKKLGI